MAGTAGERKNFVPRWLAPTVAISTAQNFERLAADHSASGDSVALGSFVLLATRARWMAAAYDDVGSAQADGREEKRDGAGRWFAV